jgi:hypothetical protein
MIACKAPFNNKWPLSYFKTQGVTKGDKQYIIMCDICHVIGGGTYMVSDLDNILHVITKDNGFCLRTYNNRSYNHKLKLYNKIFPLKKTKIK